jgi:hypothetical protein
VFSQMTSLVSITAIITLLLVTTVALYPVFINWYFLMRVPSARSMIASRPSMGPAVIWWVDTDIVGLSHSIVIDSAYRYFARRCE